MLLKANKKNLTKIKSTFILVMYKNEVVDVIVKDLKREQAGIKHLYSCLHSIYGFDAKEVLEICKVTKKHKLLLVNDLLIKNDLK